MITRRSKSPLTALMQFILVVTVGIALFAVFMPIFVSVHNNEVRTAQSRLSDLGQALSEYSEDYDGVYPCGSFNFNLGNHISLTGMGWAGQTYPYAKSPSDFDDAFGSDLSNSANGSVVAFAINSNAARNEKPATWGNRSRTVLLYQVTGARAEIDRPTEGNCQTDGSCSPAGDGSYLMLFDGTFPRSVEPATGPVGGRSTEPPYDPWPSPEVDGGSFYLMADGHVEWLTGSHVSSGTDAFDQNGVQNGVITGQAAGTANPKYTATFSTR